MIKDNTIFEIDTPMLNSLEQAIDRLPLEKDNSWINEYSKLGIINMRDITLKKYLQQVNRRLDKINYDNPKDPTNAESLSFAQTICDMKKSPIIHTISANQEFLMQENIEAQV